jgi:hypothetical protein
MERRKFTRFRVQDDAFAALRGNFSRVGKIYDISLNGLAFRYITNKNPDKMFTLVDIFLTNNGFHLYEVPCTIIYEVKETTNRLNDVVPYRCGIKFGSLDEEHQKELAFFLENHTTGTLDS